MWSWFVSKFDPTRLNTKSQLRGHLSDTPKIAGKAEITSSEYNQLQNLQITERRHRQHPFSFDTPHIILCGDIVSGGLNSQNWSVSAGPALKSQTLKFCWGFAFYSSTILRMDGLVTIILGLLATLLLVHAGYSAFESLTYEKSLDPSSELKLPLDVTILAIIANHTTD
jgi:hypothetical protein